MIILIIMVTAGVIAILVYFFKYGKTGEETKHDRPDTRKGFARRGMGAAVERRQFKREAVIKPKSRVRRMRFMEPLSKKLS
jgi:hypothetical protein